MQNNLPEMLFLRRIQLVNELYGQPSYVSEIAFHLKSRSDCRTKKCLVEVTCIFTVFHMFTQCIVLLFFFLQ